MIWNELLLIGSSTRKGCWTFSHSNIVLCQYWSVIWTSQELPIHKTAYGAGGVFQDSSAVQEAVDSYYDIW